MPTTRRWIVGGVVLVVGVVWYVFRPETAFVTRRVNEPAPAAGAIVMSTGAFEPRAHNGRGVVQLLQLGDGHRLLRLSEFETLDGPDLYVYLLGSPDAARNADLGDAYLSLGPLKGNVGAQNYAIPDGTHLDRYTAVAVWCRRFGVNFTTARLVPSEPGRF